MSGQPASPGRKGEGRNTPFFFLPGGKGRKDVSLFPLLLIYGQFATFLFVNRGNLWVAFHPSLSPLLSLSTCGANGGREGGDRPFFFHPQAASLPSFLLFFFRFFSLSLWKSGLEVSPFSPL